MGIMGKNISKISFDLPERLAGLVELAFNLWWSWHPEARMLFKRLDRQLWKESVHNPVKMLKNLPREILDAAAGDPEYLRHYDAVFVRFKHYVNTRGEWFRENVPNPVSQSIAYFSAEYGLHHSLPFYAGGLGFLAGDHLKECSDLGIPLVAVGFMYPQGYVRQKIREDGWQEGAEEVLTRDAAAITRVLNEKGEQLIIRVPLIEPPIHVAVWKVAAGRVFLYLMDTDIELNDPWNRKISARLYMGDIEQRLRQEIVLGIGGYHVLDKLGIEHAVLHLNEGHPAFVLLERIRERIEKGMKYEDAFREVKNTSVFTTHTPLPAGHDVFPFPLMETYFSSYWESLGLDRKAFFELGINPKAPEAGFNMTALALKMSTYRNAVSKRHGEVTRAMWHGLWPELAEEKVPIDHVTNGIHVPKWLEPKMMLLFNKYLGSDWLENHDDPSIWQLIDEIPDEELWQTHFWLKNKLVNVVRERARKRWIENSIGPSIILAEGAMLDPTVLTIGFARRFATYKRANLILHNRDRLKRILNGPWHPVQIVFAGKAHPADMPGKHILQEVFNAARDPEFGGRIAFVEDYGEQIAQYMVHGVDVWLNTPVPPMEASGTSGMKAALNGVPHLSISDGWWAEGFNGKNGWSFGGGKDTKNSDQADAESLYELLEKEIIPLYYKVSGSGVPHGWVHIMKETIKSNAPRFCARRMVKEYARKLYANALSGLEKKS
jgi:starch phosphorylase